MTAPPDNSGDQDRVRADQEATDWLILLQDDPDDAETRDCFGAWFSASAVNAAAWAETRHVAAIIGATPAAHSEYWMDLTDARPSTAGMPVAPARKPRRYGRRITVAVMAAATACLAILAAPNILLRLQADHVAGTAEVRTVRLEDGSTVSLSAGSAIDVAYSGQERRVRLLRGEAYFEVRRDPAHPFRVAARDVTTTVLGTGFEVSLKDEGPVVAVRHGLVRVDYPGSVPPVSENLAAGQRISLLWAGGSERGQVRPEKIAAWTQRKLIVSDRPVSEVIDDLRPWYSGVILTTGARLGSERVTGVYNLDDPSAALIALAQAHGATVRRISPWIMVISTN
jgi:transmembrane sensor